LVNQLRNFLKNSNSISKKSVTFKVAGFLIKKRSASKVYADYGFSIGRRSKSVLQRLQTDPVFQSCPTKAQISFAQKSVIFVQNFAGFFLCLMVLERDLLASDAITGPPLVGDPR